MNLSIPKNSGLSPSENKLESVYKLIKLIWHTSCVCRFDTPPSLRDNYLVIFLSFNIHLLVFKVYKVM